MKLKFKSLLELYNGDLEPKVQPVLEANFPIPKSTDILKHIVHSNRESSATVERWRNIYPTCLSKANEESGKCTARKASHVLSRKIPFQVRIKTCNKLPDNSDKGKAPISPISNNTCNSKCYSGSDTEASNVINMCSNHDSVSESTENRANIGEVSNVSEDTEMLGKVDNTLILAENRCFGKSPSSDKIRKISNEGKSKESDDTGNETTSIVRLDNDTDKNTGENKGDGEEMKLSCSSASVTSHVNELEGAKCWNAVKIPIAQESSWEVSENCLLKDSNCCVTSLKVNPSKRGQVDLSTMVRAEVHNAVEFVSSDTDMNMNMIQPSAEVAEVSDEKESLKKCSGLIGKSGRLKLHSRSQAFKFNDGMKITDAQVHVCGICGYRGHEEFLANCSNCSDGAEHIYCMRVQMGNVPEGAWMCEECVVNEQVEKPKQDIIEKLAREPEKSLSYYQRQNSGNSSTLKPEVKAPAVEKRKTDQFRLGRKFAVKRQATNLESLQVKKRQTIMIPVSKFCTRKQLSDDYPLKQVDKRKVNTNSPCAGFVPLLYDRIRDNICSRENCTSNSLEDRVVKRMGRSILSEKEISSSAIGKKTESVVEAGKSQTPRSSDSCGMTVQGLEKVSIESKSTRKFSEMENIEGLPAPNKPPNPQQLSELALMKDLPYQSSFVPERNYIWKGSFQFQTTQQGVKFSRFWDGIQAHLSSHPSLRVREFVKKLPQIVLLQTVRRLSIWPKRFSENEVTEKAIALRFSAKDLLSYEKRYKLMLEWMIKTDTCLIGKINGAVLLVFPSNLLSETSKRWNNQFFLWGVFQGKRADCPAYKHDSHIPSAKYIDNNGKKPSATAENSNQPLILGTSSTKELFSVDVSLGSLLREAVDSKKPRDFDLNYCAEEDLEDNVDVMMIDMKPEEHATANFDKKLEDTLAANLDLTTGGNQLEAEPQECDTTKSDLKKQVVIFGVRVYATTIDEKCLEKLEKETNDDEPPHLTLSSPQFAANREVDTSLSLYGCCSARPRV